MSLRGFPQRHMLHCMGFFHKVLCDKEGIVTYIGMWLFRQAFLCSFLNLQARGLLHDTPNVHVKLCHKNQSIEKIIFRVHLSI